MKTITFYAYKGGTGRTLALANAAKYLARLGQKVFVIDLDLEAPGVHHKLNLNDKLPPIDRGVVAYTHCFCTEGKIPEKVEPFTVEVPSEEDRDGRITLMPAGNVVSRTYWKELAQINWHSLLYEEGAKGVAFFLELKERIRREFEPDFLLVDARTGITEMGGVASTVLPDQVVCFLLNNKENLEGAREVIRGIKQNTANRKNPVSVLPVLARLPVAQNTPDYESHIASSVKAFLCEDAAGGDAIDLPDVLVLHTDESLAYKESLCIGSKKSVDESLLLRDYLRLFAKIVPNEMVEPHLDRLIATAQKDLLDKPAQVQAELESLAIYCPHSTSFAALLKYYRLRNAPPPKILQTAVRYWELSGQPDYDFLREIVLEYFRPERQIKGEPIHRLAEFVEDAWENSPDVNPVIGLRLLDQWLAQASTDRAMVVVHRLLSVQEPAAATVIACISRLMQADELEWAEKFVDEWATKLGENPEFQIVWASLIVKNGDVENAIRLIESKAFRPASVLSKQPQVYARLLLLANRKEEMLGAMDNIFVQSLATGDMETIVAAGALYEEAGFLDLFKTRLKDKTPKEYYDQIVTLLRHRASGPRRRAVRVQQPLFS